MFDFTPKLMIYIQIFSKALKPYSKIIFIYQVYVLTDFVQFIPKLLGGGLISDE